MARSKASDPLADGGRFHVSANLLELTNAQGEIVGAMDVKDMRAVDRIGTAVSVRGRTGRVYTIPCATLGDSGSLELALRRIMAAAAPPVKEPDAAQSEPPPVSIVVKDVAGALAGGGYYRVTTWMLELTDGFGAAVGDMDVKDMRVVSRNSNVVNIRRGLTESSQHIGVPIRQRK